MFKVFFPSTHEVNNDATLVIYQVVFSNIKLISKPGLMNHRHDETKGLYLINLSIMLISQHLYSKTYLHIYFFYFVWSGYCFNAPQCLYEAKQIQCFALLRAYRWVPKQPEKNKCIPQKIKK